MGGPGRLKIPRPMTHQKISEGPDAGLRDKKRPAGSKRPMHWEEEGQ